MIKPKSQKGTSIKKQRFIAFNIIKVINPYF